MRDSHRLRRDSDPAAVERLHRDPEAVVLVSQQPVAANQRALDQDVVRHRRVEPELLLVAGDAHVVGVEHERADTACSRSLLVGSREDEEGAGMARVRDPLLAAADPPAVSVRLGACAKRAGVRSRLGLGERECAEMLAARERRDEARPLLVGAEREQRQRDRARVHGDGDSDTGVRARELLEHEDVRDEVRAGAAVLFAKSSRGK